MKRTLTTLTLGALLFLGMTSTAFGGDMKCGAGKCGGGDKNTTKKCGGK
jgi:hypothetical protein